MSFPAHIICSFTARAIDRHHAHLAHVLQRALFHGLEGQLGVLQTQQLILGHRLIFFGQRLQCQSRIHADLLTKLCCRYSFFNHSFDPPKLFLIFYDNFKHSFLIQRFLMGCFAHCLVCVYVIAIGAAATSRTGTHLIFL